HAHQRLRQRCHEVFELPGQAVPFRVHRIGRIVTETVHGMYVEMVGEWRQERAVTAAWKTVGVGKYKRRAYCHDHLQARQYSSGAKAPGQTVTAADVTS